ncbi:MAG TPA: DinB family protein [Chitinophagaceae bacterium]|nr:DinB family protein [Chitinophagaceae bacterium]
MPISSTLSTRLQYQHKSLVDIIDGLTDEQVRRPVNLGKWSIFENMVHLQTYQHVFIARVRQILSGDHPHFERYSAEGDPYFQENCAKSTREIMQDLLGVRKEMASEIIRFKDEDFHKKGQHPVYGDLDLQQWLHFFLLHEAHHLFTIFKLASELRARG